MSDRHTGWLRDVTAERWWNAVLLPTTGELEAQLPPDPTGHFHPASLGNWLVLQRSLEDKGALGMLVTPARESGEHRSPGPTNQGSRFDPFICLSTHRTSEGSSLMASVPCPPMPTPAPSLSHPGSGACLTPAEQTPHPTQKPPHLRHCFAQEEQI